MSPQTAQLDLSKWFKQAGSLFCDTQSLFSEKVVLRVPRTATTYACRAEFPGNIFEFLEILPYGHVFGFQMGLIQSDASNCPASFYETYLEIIIGTLELWEVRGLLEGGGDLHVMAQTIQPVEKFTGERCDYEQVWADHQRLWDERPKWLEMHKLYQEDADGSRKFGAALERHAEFGPEGLDSEYLKSLGLSEAWAMVGSDGELLPA